MYMCIAPVWPVRRDCLLEKWSFKFRSLAGKLTIDFIRKVPIDVTQTNFIGSSGYFGNCGETNLLKAKSTAELLPMSIFKKLNFFANYNSLVTEQIICFFIIWPMTFCQTSETSVNIYRSLFFNWNGCAIHSDASV